MTFSLADIDLFLLVFMRMSGFLVFSPIFGRNNVPVILKGALSLVCSLLVTSTLVSLTVSVTGTVQLAVCSVLELLIGFAMGVAVSCLFSVVTVAGDLIGWQMGLSMANMYDPSQGINVPVVGNFFNAVLVLVFFGSNAHLALLSLLTDSFKAIPPGTVLPTKESFEFIVKMGGDLFELALRMALPFIAVELLVQVALGILMKAVPQINIFIIGIQLESIVGIVMLLVMVPVVTALCGRLSDYIIEKCAEILRLMMRA